MKTFFLIFFLMISSLNIFSQSKGISTGLYVVIPKDSCSAYKNINKITYQSDTLCIKQKPLISVKDIESCFADSTVLDGKAAYALNINLKKTARNKFETATRKNVGNKIAMIIDRRVVMTAVLKDPITTGRLTVSGESRAKLKDLEIKLNKEIKKTDK